MKVDGPKPWSRRRATAVVAGILVLSGLAVFEWRRHRSEHAPIGVVWAMEAIDDGAILLWSSTDESHEAPGWVSRVDVHGKTQWWSALPCNPPVGRALVVGESIATVRCTHRTAEAPYGSDQTVVAYDLATGRREWEQRMAAYDRREPMDDVGLDTYMTAAFVAGRLVEWVDRGAPGHSIFVLNPTTGKVLSQLAWDGSFGRTITIGSRVIQHKVEKVRMLDVTTGAPATYESRGTGCVIDHDYITIDGDTDGSSSLVAFPDGDFSKRRMLKAPFAPVKEALLQGCGRFRDFIVFSLSTTYTDMTSDLTVTVATRNGDVQHSITIPNDWNGETGGAAITERYHEHASLAGELPRFVPHIRDGSDRRAGSNKGPQVLVLDLEQGLISWKGPNDDSLTNAYVFRGTNEWYLISGFYQNIITVIDGDTGRITNATMAHEYEGTLEILPTHVRGGKLWIANRDHNPVNHAPVTILDAQTLAPIVKTPTIGLRDMTAQRRRELGRSD